MDKPAYTATLEYSRALIKRVVRDYWIRHTGVLLPLMTGLMLALFLFLLWRGDRSWLVGLLAAVVLFSCSFMVSMYFIHLKNSTSRLDAMGNSTAILELSEGFLRLQSQAGASELPYESVTDVWFREDYWILFLAPNQFFTIPTRNLDEDTTEFLRAKLDSRGEPNRQQRMS